MNRDPQLANFPGTNFVPETLAETAYLAPNEKYLGVVTSVSSGSTTQTFVDGPDFNYAQNNYRNYLRINGMTSATWSAVSVLTNGDTVILGSWASTDGNPTSFTVDYLDSGSSQSNAYIYISSYASNLGEVAQTNSGDTFTLGAVTNVVTDNSSLALSQTYFEIGNLTPFATANATVSSGTITINGDYASSISAGMPVVEKSYSTGPKVVQYEPATGQWSNVVFAPTTALLGRFKSTSTISVASTTDYVWGVMVFEIPSDWSDWIVQANYSFQTYPSTSGSNLGYPKIKWMVDGSQVTATPKITINESNPYQILGGSPYAYNSAQFPSIQVDLSEALVSTPTANQVTAYSLSVARNPSLDLSTPTTFCIFGIYDPRFTGYMSHAESDVVVRRLK